MVTISDLPPSGQNRVNAILSLGKDSNNGELLWSLVNSEKGKYKTAAQKTLAKLDYQKAAPLWLKLVKGKFMGAPIMTDSASDCVSESIAPVILTTLQDLFSIVPRRALSYKEIERLNFCFSLILGKASDQMLEVHRFLAANISTIAAIKHEPFYEGDNCQTFHLNEGLSAYTCTAREMAKIPALLLTVSLIYNHDRRLIELAQELYETYGKSYLLPVFMHALIQDPPEQVYERFAHELTTPQRIFLYHAFALLDYRSYRDDWFYERSEREGLRALIFWGQYSYGTYDYRFVFKRSVRLDERWLFDLAANPHERKIKVTWQSYNRSGILAESYDEMLISLLPLKIANSQLNEVLKNYFSVRARKVKVASSITVYKDAAERFGFDD